MTMVAIEVDGVWRQRWKLFEGSTGRQIVNPNSEDGLFGEDTDCTRYYKSLTDDKNRW